MTQQKGFPKPHRIVIEEMIRFGGIGVLVAWAENISEFWCLSLFPKTNMDTKKDGLEEEFPFNYGDL